MSAIAQHTPVLLERTAELLAPALQQPDAVYVDGTLGHGGHAEAILERFPHARLVGIDRDTSALELTRARLAPYADRIELVHAVYDEIGEVLAGLGIPAAQAILLDLGVSSMQLDQAERGFAYSQDAPLDMRMDPTSGITAADILNTYGHGALAHVLKTYGDERFAGKIASAVLREREKEPFTTSGRLVELLYSTIPAAARRTGGHPAKRTFQALRVEVNGELDLVAAMVPAITGELRVGGRAVFMAYQSLEDRIVKRALADITTSGTPKGLPVDLPGTAPEFRLVTRGAEKAPQHEIDDNPRAAPVRVRAVERIAQSNGETR